MKFMLGDVKKLALCNDCDHGPNDMLHTTNTATFIFTALNARSNLCDNKLPNIDLKGYQIDSIEIQARSL